MPGDEIDPPIETLVVDDVERLRSLVADALSEAGRFRIVGEATDGKEAIEQACRLEPDLVLLDLSMPRMDGLEALTEIRRQVPATTVVVLSGFKSERMEALVEDHGASDYIEKGIEPDALVQRLGASLADGEEVEATGRCCQPTRETTDPDRVHLHIVGLDTRTPKRLASAIRPEWTLSRSEGRRDGGHVDEADAIGITVPDCDDEWEPTVRSLASRHPETPIVVAVPDMPEGCLPAALEAGAADVIDLGVLDPDTLELRIRWAILTAERQGARTRRLEMLAGTMAHDLRQPLRALDRYADWVREGLGSGDQERVDTALEGMERGVDRARRLIDSQLAYARLRTKPPPAIDIDPEQPLDQVLADLEERIEGSGATVEVGSLPRVLAPPDQLESLFRNLLTNAIKYREDGQAPSIEIDGERDGEQACICVEDDGIGIDPAHQDEIFDPFTRLHAEQDYPGTGLGLAICREIVEQQGGSIEVESELGEGTTVLVRLPRPSPA